MKVRGRPAGTSQAVDAVVEGDRIIGLEAVSGRADLGHETAVLAPALIDLQVNGYGGYDFNSRFWKAEPASTESCARITEMLAASGTGLLCPTLVTNSTDNLVEALRCLVKARAEDPALATSLVGVHLEGPFISPVEGPRGAHPPEHIKDPDWDLFRRLQDEAEGSIKILTLAPERPGAVALIEKAVESGVVVSLGHSDMGLEDVRNAVAAGGSLCTHLGNGSHATLPRHPNYIWEQLATDELTACIITDLQHLPASVIKCFARVKGPANLCVVSDVVALGGLAPGIYDNGRHEVLPSGRVNLAGTPYLAGAGHLLDTCLANLRRYSGYSEAEVLGTVTTNPARVLGLTDTGRLEPGSRADLTAFRWPADGGPIEVLATVVAGEVRYRA